MNLLIFLIHFGFLFIYGLLVSMLLWHYRKYSLPKDKARWVIGTFLTFSIILAVTSTALLFFIPWEEIIKNLNSPQA